MSMANPITPGAAPEPADEPAISPDLEAVFARHFPDANAPDPSATPSGEADGGGGDLPPATTPESSGEPQPLSTLPPGLEIEDDQDGLTGTDDATIIEPGSLPSDPDASPASGDGTAGAVPSPTTTSPEDFDANAAFQAYAGRPLSRTEGESLLQFYADARQLDEDRGQMVSFLMQGGDPAELAQYLAQQYGAPAPAPQPSAPTPPAAAGGWDDDADPLPPQLAAELEQIKDTQRQLQQAEQQRLADEQARTQQWYASEVSAAADEFASAAPIEIPPEHLASLKVKANKSGLFPAFLQSNGNNPRLAYQELLRYTVASDPVEQQRWQEAVVAAEVERRLADRNRQQKASSVSAGGNAAAAAPVESAQGLTRDQARQGALEYLGNVLSNGQPS